MAEADADQWVFPPSFGQERLWLVSQMDPGSSVSNILSPPVFLTAADEATVVAALREVVRRHEALRTTLRVDDGELVQVVHRSVPVQVSRLDLSHVPESDLRWPPAEAAAEVRLPFALDRAPLWRARLVRLGATRWWLIFIVHHAIFDASSFLNLEGELSELCAAAVEGRPPRLPELPIQYADYAVFSRQQMSGPALDAELAHWRQRLEGFPAVHALPLDRPRPARQSYAGDEVRFTLPGDIAAGVRRLSGRLRASPFTVLLAAYVALLQRLSGQSDLVVGVPMAGRGRRELAPLIGMFVNTIPLRVSGGGDPPFGDLVERVRVAAAEADEHQSVPFQRLVEALVTVRDPSVAPLYQIGFNYLVGASQLNRSHGTAQSELLLELSDAEARLEYRTDLFDPGTVHAMAHGYVRLLLAAVADPATRLSELPMMSAAQRELMIRGWNETPHALPEVVGVHELVLAHAGRNPDAVAVVTDSVTLTYRELRDRVDSVARRLRRLGVGRDRLVAVFLPRCPDLVVSWLGVLAAGGAYIPLDPAYPGDRLAFMLADTAPAAVVTSRALRDRLPADAWPVLCAEEMSGAEDIVGDAEPDPDRPDVTREGRPSDLAYVIYTSGSTGQPKGVMIEHRSLVNFVVWFNREFGIDAGERILVSSSPSFDAFGVELYPALAAGGTVVLTPPSAGLDPDALLETAARTRVTTLPTVPAVLRLVVDSPVLARCTHLRQVVCGGEQLSGELVTRLTERLPVRLHNLYGPTEATIAVSWHTCADDDRPAGFMPIGRPIANTRLYVLDARGEPVPVGVQGELHIGGMAVARGYLGRPELNAERFVPDPFGSTDSRLYRTGDLARWRPDGELEFLGRMDSQVKIRGFRVELAEVEGALRQQPGVRDAAVIVREGASGEGRLVGYLVPESGEPTDTTALRAALRAVLPEHMVPSMFVTIDALPLTPNGKLDKRALPPPQAPPSADAYVQPQTASEELVASVWAEVLGVDRVGAQDNFFDVGGDSLRGARVIARLNAATDLRIPLDAIFNGPTVTELAATVEQLVLADIEQLSEDEALHLAAGA